MRCRWASCAAGVCGQGRFAGCGAARAEDCGNVCLFEANVTTLGAYRVDEAMA